MRLTYDDLRKPLQRRRQFLRHHRIQNDDQRQTRRQPSRRNRMVQSDYRTIPLHLGRPSFEQQTISGD
jgi:hypothetical protein